MKNKFLLLSGILLLFLSFGCKQSDLVLQWDKVRDYHLLYMGIGLQNQDLRNVDFYLDFTEGLKVAFQNDNSKKFFDAVINSMKINTIDFYEVANDSISLIENMPKGDMFAKLENPSNYDKEYAPLDKALDKIAESNNFSIFVTDGELWKKKVGEKASESPWAREAFAKWLKKGNRIDFYITDHPDAGKTKHLFYMIFIPKSFNGEKLPSDDISYFLQNDIAAKRLVYSSFTFSNDFFTLKQDYPTEQSSGSAEEMALDMGSYKKDLDLGYEYMDFALGWKDIVKYIRNAKDENSGNPIPGGKDFIRKLFLNAKNNELYQLNEIGIKTYDIYEDYSKFEFCKQCQAKPPLFKLDEKGNKVLDLNNNNMPFILEEGLKGCYDEKGDLLSERKYSGPDIKPIEELFQLDNKLFNYTYSRDTVGEIGLKIHPNFNGTQLSSTHENFVKVDILLTKCKPNTSNPKFEKFIWQGKQITQNKALYESIILAIQDANPEGKVIYSYYIKTLPNNYFE